MSSIPSARIVPFISGSTRSLNAEMKANAISDISGNQSNPRQGLEKLQQLNV
jgi:hypothetical protein